MVIASVEDVEGERLTQAQVALVLRRAAELDGDDEGDDARLDACAVEAAAVEAGLSRAVVHQALAELRVGALEAAAAPMARPLFGPPTLTVGRVVPGPLQRVERELRAYLRAQLFEQRRDFDDRSLWMRREGLAPSIRRSLDFNHRLSLNGVRHVELSLAQAPGEGARVVVSVAADVRQHRNTHARAVSGGAVVGAGLVGATAVVAGLDPAVLASLPVGAGVVFGSHRLGRSHYRRQVDQVHLALAGMLDRLEHRLANAPRKVVSA